MGLIIPSAWSAPFSPFLYQRVFRYCLQSWVHFHNLLAQLGMLHTHIQMLWSIHTGFQAFLPIKLHTPLYSACLCRSYTCSLKGQQLCQISNPFLQGRPEHLGYNYLFRLFSPVKQLESCCLCAPKRVPFTSLIITVCGTVSICFYSHPTITYFKSGSKFYFLTNAKSTQKFYVVHLS